MNENFNRSDSFVEKERNAFAENDNPHQLRDLIDYKRKLGHVLSLRISSRSTEVVQNLIALFDPEYLESDKSIGYSSLYTRAKLMKLPFSLYLQSPSRSIVFKDKESFLEACTLYGNIFRSVIIRSDLGLSFSDLLDNPLERLEMTLEVPEGLDQKTYTSFKDNELDALSRHILMSELDLCFSTGLVKHPSFEDEEEFSISLFRSIFELPNLKNLVISMDMLSNELVESFVESKHVKS